MRMYSHPGTKRSAVSRTQLKLLLGLSVAALVAIAGVSGCETGGKFPTKPITIVVYTAPGSPGDLNARLNSKLADKTLKVSLPVENRTAGDTVAASTYVVSQPADGYTVYVVGTQLSYSLAKPDTPAKVDEFEGVIRQHAQPSAIIVRSDSEFKTLDDFIQYAKANPGKLKVGGTGTGSLHHVTTRQISKAVGGAETTWVAFSGGSEVVAALLGGHVGAGALSPSAALQHVKAGSLRILGIGSEKRVDYLPDVPTYKEKGINVVALRWQGIVAKKGTPRDALKVLHDAFKEGMQTQEWKDYLDSQKEDDAYMNGDDLTKFMTQEVSDAQVALKEMGLIK